MALLIEKVFGMLFLCGYKVIRDLGLLPDDVKKEIRCFWVLEYNIMIKSSPDDLFGDLNRALNVFINDQNRLFHLVKLVYYMECLFDADWVLFVKTCSRFSRSNIWRLCKISCVLKMAICTRNVLAEARNRNSPDNLFYVDVAAIPEF